MIKIESHNAHVREYWLFEKNWRIQELKKITTRTELNLDKNKMK